MDAPTAIAGTILDGFDRHYRLFRESSAGAKDRFERGAWAEGRAASRARIDMYDQRVVEAVAALHERFANGSAAPAINLRDETLWHQVKLAFIGLLYGHRQPECAETFYNSVACRVLHRSYYQNEYIFWRPAVSTEHLESEAPTYRCYYPGTDGLARSLRRIGEDFRFRIPFANLNRDLRRILRAVRKALPAPKTIEANFQIQVLSSPFYRNRRAFVLGKVVNGTREQPFAAPLRRNEEGKVEVDAILFEREHIANLFSLAHVYFAVDMEVPSAYVAFLKALMPDKPKAELYTSIGLQKQGKTLFYRDLFDHLKHSTDKFTIAPGTRGMVMLVFAMPSFPYVFKLIRDSFDYPKDSTPEQVKQKYWMVKHHDRVGRLADTLEYSEVALPVCRFDPALVEEIQRLCGKIVEREGEDLVIKHMYIEQRMVPLDLYLKDAAETPMQEGVREFGQAIRELAQANIFAGDLLPKNFGVTRYGRVVFYDYDEVCYLTECHFRGLPEATNYDDEMAAEPWYSVGPSDVFPQEFDTFLFPPGRARQLFRELHGDLLDPAFWIHTQDNLTAGKEEDVWAYPLALRLQD